MILIINITIFVGQKEKNNEDRRKVTDVSWRHKFSTMGPFTQDWLVSVMYCFEMSVLLTSQTIMALPLIPSSPEWVKNEPELCA